MKAYAALLTVLALSTYACAQSVSSTFENGTVGARIVGTNLTGGTPGAKWGGSDAKGSFTYSDERPSGGALSGKLVRTDTNTTLSFGALLNGASGISYSNGTMVLAQADFFVPDGAPNGASFGLDCFTADLSNIAAIHLYGGDGWGNGILATHNEALKMERALDASGNLLTYTKGTWNTLTLEVDYNATSLTSRYFFNGSPIYYNSGSGIVPLVTAPLSQTTNYAVTHAAIHSRGWTSTGTASASAYVDNYSVTVNPVPEPATIAGLGLAVGALLRRRNRKAEIHSPSRPVVR